MSTLRNIKRHVPAVSQSRGILQVDQIQLPTESTTPADGNLAAGRIYCDGSTIYGYNGSAFVDMLASASYNISAWDDIYDMDKTLTLDGGTLTFNLTGATDGLTLSASAAATGGALLQFANSGAAADIQGTGDTWNITKAGAATLVGVICANIDAAASGNVALTIDAAGTGTITLGATSTGAITLTRAVTATASLTITGTAATDVFTITAGDAVMSDSSLTITDADEAATLSITNNTAAAVNVVDINADAIAAGGVILHLDSLAAGMSTGLFFECYDGAASAFTIGLYGATVIAGNAATDVFTITAGDMVGSDTSLTLTDADNATTLSVTNNTATTAAVLLVAGSGTFTGDSFVGFTPSGLTTGSAVGITADALTTGEALLISVDAITSGKGIQVENVGEALTSGELLALVNTESGDLATKTGNLASITSSITETGIGNVTINYDALLISRTDAINDATTAATYTAQGSALKVLHTSTQTASTLTDTAIGLEVELSGATALGHAVQITNVGATGSALNVVSANVGADDVLITASGAHTDGFAGLHVTVTGNLADGGAACYLEQKTGTATTNSRMFEIVAASDMRAVYIDVDSVTNDCVYIQSDGDLAAGKAVLHVNNGGAPAADNVYVGHFSYDGAATNESVVLFADGGGKDVTGLLVDCDPAYAANNLSGHITLFSDAAGDLPVIMNFYHSDAGAVSGEYCANIYFYGSDDAAAKELYGSIEVEQDDASAANPDGIVWIKGDLAGTNTVSAGFTGNKVMLGAAAATLTSAGAWDLTLSTASTAANEPRIVLTDGANGDITITAGGTAGDVVLGSPITVENSVGVTADIGSAQGNGAFTETFLEISTVGTTGDAVTLPAAEAGKMIIITNRGANAADVFPISGDNINEAGVNTAKALAADTTMLLMGIDGTHWEAVLLART